jgi:hypothetical protein
MKAKSIVLITISSVVVTTLLFWGYTRLKFFSTTKPLPEMQIIINAADLSNPPIINGVILHNQSNQSLDISNVISKKSLVYYIPNGSCPPCVEKDLQILDTLKFENKEMEILIFCKIEDLKMFQIFSLQNKRQLPMYNIKEGLAKFGIGQNMRPIYFTIDKNLEVTNIFQSNPEIMASHSYFAEIVNMFKSNSLQHSPPLPN